jgi:hypothetical protein
MNGEAWQPQTILRFIQSIPTSTNVVRVDTDAGEGFLKAMGNPEGPHVLACELVGTLLAEWLGLPTLDHSLVWVTPEDEIPLAGGGLAAPGPAFITKAVNGFPWGGDEGTLRRIRNLEDISRLVVLDTWIRNCDRHRPEPNLRVNRDNVFLAWESAPERGLFVKAMDQTHAFTCGRELTRRLGDLDNVRDTTIFGCFPEFVLLLDREHVQSTSFRLGEMDGPQAERVVARVPAEWQVEAPVRQAWSRFIVERAAFVAANMAAWLWP